MAKVRTERATVKRLLGGKGVSIEEVTRLEDGREFKAYFAAWVGDGHGLNVGDSAQFLGGLGVKKTEKNGTTYVDVNINNATVLEGTLQRAEPARGSWEQDGGAPWGGDAA